MLKYTRKIKRIGYRETEEKSRREEGRGEGGREKGREGE